MSSEQYLSGRIELARRKLAERLTDAQDACDRARRWLADGEPRVPSGRVAELAESGARAKELCELIRELTDALTVLQFESK